MNVADLREALKGQPDDRLVLVARDAEGNGFHALDEVGTSEYDTEDDWSYDLLSDEDEDDDYVPLPEDVAVVLWP